MMFNEKNLAKAIGEKYNVNEDWIICGSEPEDLIHRFVYGLKPEKAVVMQPTGFSYEAELRCIGTEVVDYNLFQDHFKVKHDMLALVETGVDAVFMCNPNDPTGVLSDKALILEVLEKARKKGIYVVIDEQLLSLTGRDRYASLLSDVSAYDNLIVIRSVLNPAYVKETYLSYSVCKNEKLCACMRSVDWPCDVDEEKALAVLDDDRAVTKMMRFYNGERKFMEAELSRLGLKYFLSYVNFILIHCPGNTELLDVLTQAGVMAESCGTYKNLGSDYYKVMIGCREENEKLIEVLESNI